MPKSSSDDPKAAIFHFLYFFGPSPGKGLTLRPYVQSPCPPLDFRSRLRSSSLAVTVPALRKDEWTIFSKFFDPFFLSKNRGLAKNRYHHEIGRKKIRRMVYSDREKLNGRPDFDTFSFFGHLSHSSFRSARTASPFGHVDPFQRKAYIYMETHGSLYQRPN